MGIVDERSGPAGCYRGSVMWGAQRCSGRLSQSFGDDDACQIPSPQLVVTDELGRAEDARAVEEVIIRGQVYWQRRRQNVRELMRSLIWHIYWETTSLNVL